MLDDLDHLMIPGAKDDPQLASTLRDARPKIETHVKQAQELRTSLKA